MSQAAPSEHFKLAPNPDGTRRGDIVPFSLEDESALHEAAQTLVTDTEFIKYIHRLCDNVSAPDQEAKRLRRKKTIKLRNYIAGNHLGYVDDSGKWIDRSDDGDGLYYDPETATYIDVLLASIVKAKPTIKISPASENNIRQREAARVAQLLWDEARKRFNSAKRVQKEVKYNLLAAGETYRYTFFNPNIPDAGYEKETFKPQVVGKNQTVIFCKNCNKSHAFDDDLQTEQLVHNEQAAGINVQAETQTPAVNGQLNVQNNVQDVQNNVQKTENLSLTPPAESSPNAPEDRNCPHCGNNDVLGFVRKQNKISIRKGTEWVNVGDSDCEFIDPLEMTVVSSGTQEIGAALAVQRDRLVARCVLEDAFDIDGLPTTAVPYHLRYKLSSKGNIASDLSANTDEDGREFEELHFQETWLAPSVYSRYVFRQDTQLRNGQMIPAGTRLKDIFPRGIYFARSGQFALNLYGQAISDCLSHASNHVGEDFHGIGEWDLSAMQDQLNEISSMKMNSLLKDSTSPLIYRPDAIEGGQLKNKFGSQVPVKPEFADKTGSLDNVAKRIQTGGGIPEAYDLATDLRQRMVNRSGAMTSTGAGGADTEAVAKTASAYRLWYEHTLGRRAGMLALRAEMEVEQAGQVLTQKQQYHCAAMLEDAEKKTGDDAVKWFFECNISRDLRIEAVPDSWMPQTESQIKLEFQEFLGIIAPMVAAKPQIIDKILSKASELYRSFDLTEHLQDTTEAQIRLEKVIDLSEFVEKEATRLQLPLAVEQPVGDGTKTVLIANPLLIQTVMSQSAQALKIVHTGEDVLFAAYPVDVMFDDHEEFEKVYKDWLVSSEGRRASSFVRASINHLAIAHKKALFEFQRQMETLALAAQQPQLEAELIANDATHKLAMQQKDAEHAQALNHNEDLHGQSLQHQGESQPHPGNHQGTSRLKSTRRGNAGK